MRIHKTPIIIASLLVLVAAIPATYILSQNPQENRSRASASSSLYFAPTTSQSTPLQKNINDTVSMDVMVDPGSNIASLVKLEIDYDATKFTPSANSFTVNTAAFPTVIEGPVVQSGKLFISVSIGSDTTKAIQKITKVGTVSFTAVGASGVSPTTLTFGVKSQILSVAPSDQSNENVLATAIPAYILIAGAPTAVPSQVPTTLPSPTMTLPTPTKAPTPTIAATTIPSPTLSATAIPSPTVTLSPQTTALTFNVLMHSIGSSGDNANPNASDLSNKNPLHQSRDVTVTIYNDQNQLVITQPGTLAYNTTQGTYTGTIILSTPVPLGQYTVRIKEPLHLRRLIPGIQTLTPQKANVMPIVALVAGDTNNDNTINILDYNTLVGCYSDLLPAADCDDTRKVQADLDDNGAVNQFDYNLFLREITVQAGN